MRKHSLSPDPPLPIATQPPKGGEQGGGNLKAKLEATPTADPLLLRYLLGDRLI
jgi:hypothetical protein